MSDGRNGPEAAASDKESRAAQGTLIERAGEGIDELPMDHGLRAWLQVLGSWVLFANTWYVEIFLMMLIGVCAGWLIDAGYLPFILIGGTFMTRLGMLLLSLCTKYWQILLAQAFCVGIGSGLLGLTSVAVIPLYFRKKRMVATGIAATGSSAAGILYPIMERRLFVSIGFPWAVRALAFLILGSLLPCAAIMRLRPNSKRRGALFELKHLRDAPYAVFCVAFALMIATVYVPFFFIEDYGLALEINSDFSFYLLSIMNAASLLGRLGSNWLADKYGGISVMLPCCFLSAITLFFFRFAHDLGGLVAVSIVYGCISGGMVSLPPATIANLTDDMSEYGTRMGMGYTIASIGALVGNPIGGAAQRPRGTTTTGSIQQEFQGAWLFAGAGMLAAVASMLVMGHLKSGLIMRDKS
ncbi:MAG: hypothetical protein Q9195_003287 [Heterodermia aff. obscurata]